MASQALIQQLEEQLETINQYENVDLISRRDWGIITFDVAAADIDLARSIAADLSSMPLRYLTDQAAIDITQLIPDVAEHLRLIDEFKLEGAPAAERDNIAANLQGALP